MSEPNTPPSSSTAGRVFDHRRLPAGVVPRHLQQWVLIGTALVMVGILALSGPPPASRPTALPSPASTAVDANQQRIEEYQRRIQEQAQRLAAEQAQLQLTKDALTVAVGDSPGGTGVRLPTGPETPPATVNAPRDTRDDRARFADSVAFARGGAGDGNVRANASDGEPMFGPVSAPVGPPGLPGLPGGIAPPTMPTPTSVSTPPATGPIAPIATGAPRYTVFEGTFIDTVLTNRLDGTFNGPVNCLVSVPVYADDHLVIPAGARVLGEARAVNAFGQSRLAVTFHRLRFPNGESLSLDQFRGLNQVGESGLHDQVDRHYAQIFGVSLALGLIGGLTQGHSAVGLEATGADLFRQGAAASIGQSSARVLDRFLNLLPTVTIREGHRIKVILSQDLALPTYAAARSTTGGRP